MTTLHLIELSCPVCAHDFRSQTVVASDGTGVKRTDFHERASGMPALPYFIHLCTHCGYAGLSRDFLDPEEPSHSLRDRVQMELTPALAASLPSGSLKYEHAAKVAEWQGADPRYLADLHLRAAWCCVDEGDTEAERYFRRHAAWRFAEALAIDGLVPPEERAVLTYLVGELWRRIGDVQQARGWYDLVPEEIHDVETQHWVLRVTMQQKTNPQEWF